MSSSSQQLTDLAVGPDDWVDHYGDYLYRYAFMRLRDSSAAEEAVQETFLAGFRSQQQFAGKGLQRSWLTGILKRKIVDYMRLQSKREQHSLDEEDEEPTAELFDEQGQWKPGVLPALPADEQLESSELWQVVRNCLRRIPQGQADVFVLSVMEEMAADQICEALGISKSNLWVRLHRARLGLARCVGLNWSLTREGAIRDE